MASLVIDGDQLLLHLTWRERAAGFHWDIRVPLHAVTNVTVVTNVWLSLRGWRMAGITFPTIVGIGTRRHPDGYDFVALHRNSPVVQVDLNSPPRWQRLVVSVADGVDPSEVADQIAAAAGIRRA